MWGKSCLANKSISMVVLYWEASVASGYREWMDVISVVLCLRGDLLGVHPKSHMG